MSCVYLGPRLSLVLHKVLFLVFLLRVFINEIILTVVMFG